jgi:glutamate-ammonia-ligase adenylyltransferase
MLVSSLESFEDYQRNEAWVWERQALVRARPVAGDTGLAERFSRIRARVLTSVSGLEHLRAEVRDMRERMRGELGTGREAGFHLKHDRGGIVDIEFMVQFLTLRWCREHPQLLSHTATVQLLNELAGLGLLEAADAQTLIDAYREYRVFGHGLTLAEVSTVVDEGMLRNERNKVAEIWRRLMEG